MSRQITGSSFQLPSSLHKPDVVVAGISRCLRDLRLDLSVGCRTSFNQDGEEFITYEFRTEYIAAIDDPPASVIRIIPCLNLK